MNARGCRPTPSSRWRRTLSSPRLIAGKFTDTAHLLETQTSWGYCRWCEEHWGGVSSRDRQPFSRDSNLKSCVVTRVVHISVFPVSRVTVFHVEGDATVDEGDACLIGQTVIIGIDHDTVCAGVIGTAIRHSTSCAGRLAAGTTSAVLALDIASEAMSRASAVPDCSTKHDSADRISGQFLFYHDHNFTKSKGNLRFQRLVPLFVPIGVCVTTHDDGTASDVTIGMWRHNQQATNHERNGKPSLAPDPWNGLQSRFFKGLRQTLVFILKVA